MSVERHIWVKGFFIPRALRCFAVPSSVVESEARSTLYHLRGLERGGEPETVVFQYTLSGSCLFTRDDREWVVDEGKAFLTYVSDPEITYRFPDDATAPYRFIYLNFRDPLGCARALIETLGHVYTLPAVDSVIRRLREFGQLSESTIELTAGEGHLLVNRLLARLADGIRSELSDTPQVRIVRRAERLVRENLHRPYNAGMLADDLGISQEHLCRIFRQEVAKTPLSFLNEIKVRSACELLRTTSMTCRSIAEQLGYDPGSHFARVFKRTTGMTPMEFRRREIIAF